MVEFGFAKLRLTRIIARAHTENLTSIRIMEKLGLNYEGRRKNNRVQYSLERVNC